MTEILKRIGTSAALAPALLIIWYGGWLAAGLIGVVIASMLTESIKVAALKRQCQGGLLLAEKMLLAVLIILLGLMALGLMNLAFLASPVPWLLIMVLIITAVDIFAFLVGKVLGGQKLAVAISPSKTWSGACGGVVGGCVVAVFSALIFGVPMVLMLMLGVVAAVLSILGDLFESFFKRVYGVKDSGKILPGHGGFLDRFDGYIFTAPAFYLAYLMGWIDV